ncbi:MAG: methyltransferase, partial [Asgard group archaeon]|nr:methyltransferase [Asgard group archaeon]
EIFSDIYGKPYFSWLEDDTTRANHYQKAMESYAKRDYQSITEIYNFSSIKCLMDVGGGSGILLDFVLEKYQELKGILFEQEKSIKAAKMSNLKNKLNRCEFFVGDFFKEIPKGADGIILARILHDWDDKEANIVLQNCNAALNLNDKLFLVELILPSDMNDPFGGLLSLNMLALTGGKERTKEELETLLNSNGFELVELRKLNSVSSLIVASKIKNLR